MKANIAQHRSSHTDNMGGRRAEGECISRSFASCRCSYRRADSWAWVRWKGGISRGISQQRTRIYDHFAPIIADKSLFKQKKKTRKKGKEGSRGVSGISSQDAPQRLEFCNKMCLVTITIINGRSSLFAGAEGIVNNKIWNKKKEEQKVDCCTLCRNQSSGKETPFASPPAAP